MCVCTLREQDFPWGGTETWACHQISFQILGFPMPSFSDGSVYRHTYSLQGFFLFSHLPFPHSPFILMMVEEL